MLLPRKEVISVQIEVLRAEPLNVTNESLVYFETSEPNIATTKIRGYSFVFGLVLLITINCDELKVATIERPLLAGSPGCNRLVSAKSGHGVKRLCLGNRLAYRPRNNEYASHSRSLTYRLAAMGFCDSFDHSKSQAAAAALA